MAQRNIKCTIEEIKSRMKNENIELLSTEYKNNKAKLMWKCKIDGHIFYRNWHNMQISEKCPECIGRRRDYDITIIKDKLQLINPNIEILSEEYISVHSKLKCKCLIDGHEWLAQWANLSSGYGCPKCSKNVMPNMQEIISEVFKINPNILVLSKECKSAKSKLHLRCLIDNHEWWATWNSLTHNKDKNYKRCPMCNGLILCDSNRVSIVRPDLVKYFKHPEEAHNLTQFSSVKINAICPECGFEKQIPMSRLAKKGLSCNKCSDGISIPNKFIAGVLSQVDCDFEVEKQFEWSNSKRYDSFINSHNIIIEMHGIQHYEDVNIGKWKGRTFVEEVENDEIKKAMAQNNNIENYIVIDARRSDYEYLKASVIEKLSSIFDLSNICWDTIYQHCNSSEMVKSWDLYNDGFDTMKISKLLKLSRPTITEYLHKGNKLGKVKYETFGKRKRVIQKTLNGDIVCVYNSIPQINKKLGLGKASLRKVCDGKKTSHGGFIWEYKEVI